MRQMWLRWTLALVVATVTASYQSVRDDQQQSERVVEEELVVGEDHMQDTPGSYGHGRQYSRQRKNDWRHLPHQYITGKEGQGNTAGMHGVPVNIAQTAPAPVETQRGGEITQPGRGHGSDKSEDIAVVNQWHHNMQDRLLNQLALGDVKTGAEGYIFQAAGCPQAISETEAKARRDDESLPGNIIILRKHGYGREGNHFMSISSYLAMGYCCRSRLLMLPDEDHPLVTKQGRKLRPSHRWFDFSNSASPRSEYAELYARPEVCKPMMDVSGNEGFKLTDVHDDLLSCMNRVFVRGCEALHLGPIVPSQETCHSYRNATTHEAPEEENRGSLVVHIRSGDIFDPEGDGKKQPRFGQPPLQFYLKVILSRDWEDVTVLTASPKREFLNPTFTALQHMAGNGALGHNVKMIPNRPLFVDLHALMCADAIVSARSSLEFLTFAHSRAKRYFIPGPCGPGTYRRQRFNGLKATPDNTTLLLLEKPEAEVYGIEWDRSTKPYSVYDTWLDTPEQLHEMLHYKGIKRLERCHV